MFCKFNIVIAFSSSGIGILIPHGESSPVSIFQRAFLNPAPFAGHL